MLSVDEREEDGVASGLGPEFRKLRTASTISNLGDGVTLVAAPLLVAGLTRDPLLIAGAVFVRQLAWLLFSLHAGALVDRLDRRLLMGYVDLSRSALIGFLGIAVLLDLASIPLLYAVFFLIGAAEPLFDKTPRWRWCPPWWTAKNCRRPTDGCSPRRWLRGISSVPPKPRHK